MCFPSPLKYKRPLLKSNGRRMLKASVLWVRYSRWSASILYSKKLTAGWVECSLSDMHQLFTLQKYNKFLTPARGKSFFEIFETSKLLSTPHFTGQGAWATAKNRSSARPKAELSGVSLRAGRGVSAERLPSARRHSPP